MLKKAWTDLPEGCCRGYTNVTCIGGTLGRDFFGGDIQGIAKKLDYLQTLGVTALYLNPIFRSPSNHGYANQGTISGLNAEQFDGALHSIQEDYPAPAFATLMNLVDSHDTQRILWALTPGDRNCEDKEFNAASIAQGKAKQKLLAILQMTLPGAPTIYYGDEIGATGDTDPDDRRPMPWATRDLDMLSHYERLTGLRNANSFLRTGSFDRLWTHNQDGTYAYGRRDDSGAAIVAVNKDSVAHALSVGVSGYIPEGTMLTDALGGGTYAVSEGRVSLNVAAGWGAILLTPGEPTSRRPQHP